MYIRRITEQFKLEEIKEIANFLSKYFQLVTSERIYNLILQVDSIDLALHLLNIHKNSAFTLDEIVYFHLDRYDNKKYERD